MNMKCNIKSSYIELTVPQFLAMYPQLAENCMRYYNILELLGDDEYIVRVASDGRVEFGYREDKWFIS